MNHLSSDINSDTGVSSTERTNIENLALKAFKSKGKKKTNKVIFNKFDFYNNFKSKFPQFQKLKTMPLRKNISRRKGFLK